MKVQDTGILKWTEYFEMKRCFPRITDCFASSVRSLDLKCPWDNRKENGRHTCNSEMEIRPSLPSRHYHLLKVTP